MKTYPIAMIKAVIRKHKPSRRTMKKLKAEVRKFRDYEPEQVYGSHHDKREHIKHGGTPEDY